MKARHKVLCDHSISMALAAVEVYNKPNFPGREQVFSILMVNAWESLAKAKIIKDAGNRLTALYIKDKGRFKRTRRGAIITIDIMTALARCPLQEVVRENVQHLVDVRNAATHLTASSQSLPLLVFSLGSASLMNYARLANEWFGISLNEYNFYILPLGFSYPFTHLSAVDPSTEPDDVAQIIQAVAANQERDLDRDGFSLICEMEIALISAKKVTQATDLTAKIEPKDGASLVLKPANLLDRYPLSYTEAYQRIKQRAPHVNQTHINRFIREQAIKGNSDYSAYHYRNNKERERGPNKSTQVIYNDDFVNLCVGALQ